MSTGGTNDTTMSDHSAADHVPDPAHHADEHDPGHEEHHADTLGPVDWRMWGVGALGVIAALIVVACWAVGTQFVFITGA
jgi:hypothetical protein